MTFITGTKLESFEIIDLLGAGGMGEVYRARDTRLNRNVAIKVLPEAFASDPDRLARFQREAQVLASLSHANIGVIHGIHESRGTRFLVLELVEGETLAARLQRGAVPVDDALELLKQVAAALEAAHEKGILHRDLKPANIQITPDGVVKVLDFGLAKMLETEAAPVDPSNSPTMNPSQTVGGAILGTAAYMSPEQARGRTVDKRTDVWAFGCVAYETLTGQQAFGGETVTDIIASLMKGEPDWSRVPAGTPFILRSLLRQCLNKQARHRLHEIADARIALEDASTEPALPTAASATIAPPDRRWMVTGFAAFLLIGAVIGWFAKRNPAAKSETMHFEMSLGTGEKLVGSISSVRPSRTAIAVHPNGKMVVFSGDAMSSPPQLYAREFSQPDAHPLPGTQGARGPFLSPDGQWIGFFSNGQIKKVPVGGGPAVVICDVSKDTQGLYGASWAEDGTIFFSDRGQGISKVPSAGGTPAKVTTSDLSKGEMHILPQVLPGAKAVIFTSVIAAAEWDRARVIVQSLETQESRTLIEGGADARYVPTGHLLFMKMGTLMAVPFDVRQLRVTGEPFGLIEGVMQAVNSPNGDDETGSGQFALSNTGTLVYATGGLHPSPESSVLWLDRKGGAAPVAWAPLRTYRSPRLSPDQSKVILMVFGPSRTSDVWVYDTLRGAPTRLTFSGSNWPALWSPDGKRVVFSNAASGVKNLYLANADGSGQAERLTTSEFDQVPSSWSAKNDSIAFMQFGKEYSQIWVLPMDSRKPKLFLESRFGLRYPEFSPDGHWIAYVSSESGRDEVYVQPYPGPGEKHRVSTEGGGQPIWTASGGELLFRRSWQEFFSATITSLDPFRSEAPRLVFQSKSGGFSSTTPVRAWDMTPDGQRFLVTQDQESKDKPVTHLQIVLNWNEELQRRAPTK